MIIKDNTDALVAALADVKLTILLLSGDETSPAGKVHTFLDGQALEPWRRYFLIIDPNGLDPQERDTWFGGANTDLHAVLGGRIPKQVACAGPVAALLGANGEPSILKIRSAYAKGDQL